MKPSEAHARRLKIAVVGPGAIGSAFAYRLARAGHDVTVVGRGKRLEELERDGAIVLVDGERAAVTAAATLDATTAWDVVLVTVPATQVFSPHADADGGRRPADGGRVTAARDGVDERGEDVVPLLIPAARVVADPTRGTFLVREECWSRLGSHSAVE
mgnify:CR=1 FL=1